MRFLFFIFLLSLLIKSQNINYWNNKFGNEANFLQGSNIATISDFGAIFHNPARIIAQDKNMISMQTKAYSLTNFHADNNLGNDLNFHESILNPIPSLLGGNIGFLSTEKSKFAYSFITKTKEVINLSFISNPTKGEFFEEIPGNEIFNNSIFINKKLTDDWVGITWAYKISDKFSVGITSSLSILSGFNNSTITNKLLTEDNSLIVSSQLVNYTIFNLSLINKIGLSYNLNNFSLGSTFTLPNIKVLGKGNFSYEFNQSGFDNINPELFDLYISNVQKKIKSNYKKPFSFSIGTTYKIDKFSFSVAGEWFSKIDEYEMLVTDSIKSISTPQQRFKFDLVSKNKSIINYSAGISYQFSDKLKLYCGYAKDNNPYSEDGFEYANAQLFNIVNSDFNHYSIGSIYQNPKFSIALGFNLSNSKSISERKFNIVSTTPKNDSEIVELENTNFRQIFYQVNLGFSIPLSNN